jgi:hypothetical protein
MFSSIGTWPSVVRTAALSLAVLFSSKGDAMAAPQFAPQRVLLSCPFQAPRVCDAITAAITEALATDIPVQIVPPDQITVRGPGDLGFEIRLNRVSATALSGRLILHGPGSGPPLEGTEIGAEAVDTVLSDAMIATFAKRLLSTHEDTLTTLVTTGAARAEN